MPFVLIPRGSRLHRVFTSRAVADPIAFLFYVGMRSWHVAAAVTATKIFKEFVDFAVSGS